jgi:hypothetical protein
MAALPAAAAAAYQSIANIGSASTAQSAIPTAGAQGNFGDFLSDAIKDSVSTMKTGEQMATKQVAGQHRRRRQCGELGRDEPGYRRRRPRQGHPGLPVHHEHADLRIP